MKLSPAIPFDGRFLRMTSALLGAACVLLLSSSAHAEFDPNAGAYDSTAPASLGTLPDTTVLRTHTPVRPLYMNTAPAVAPAATPQRSLYGATSGSYISPLQPIQMPRPLYPERAAATAPSISYAPASAPTPATAEVTAPVEAAPGLPPVDATTAARAQQILQAQDAATTPAVPASPAIAATADTGFIAPAPVMAAPVTPATITPVTTRIVSPAAVAVAPVAAAAPAPRVVVEQPTELKQETRNIIAKIPSKIDTKPTPKTSKVALQRVSPEIQNVLGKDAAEESYESVGLSIKVRRPGLDTNYELNQAYTSLMGGDTEHAIEIYQNILGAEPRNEEAMFGLAATYHRLGQTDKARTFYGMLLKQNPEHREALNNFLVLMSDESPQDALPELERLELRNPDFSPIPAQIAVVLDRLNYGDKAEDKMLRAIELAPDNLTYKYNLAVMLDRHQKYNDATAMYRMLIDASLRGETVPATVDSMQKRLNYLATALTERRTGS